MGQAFDHNGNVLGEAFGATKREVFDKLNNLHQDAQEIRVKTLSEGALTEMPRYRCHKEVHALKISGIDHGIVSSEIMPADAGFAPFRVAAEWVFKHQPVAGGYYVVYADGYTSFSPAAAFEEGYTRIEAQAVAIRSERV